MHVPSCYWTTKARANPEQGQGLDQGEADEHQRADLAGRLGLTRMPSTVLPTRKPMPMPARACPGRSR